MHRGEWREADHWHVQVGEPQAEVKKIEKAMEQAEEHRQKYEEAMALIGEEAS